MPEQLRWSFPGAFGTGKENIRNIGGEIIKQIFIKKGQAVVCETPVPAAGPGSVLVQVFFSLISAGTEMSGIERSGQSLVKKVMSRPEAIGKAFNLVKEQGVGNAIDRIKRKIDTLEVTGYSCSGKVVGMGEGVRDIRAGDYVACAGAGKANHAEYVSVPRNLVVKIPEGCPLRDASSVTLGAIALQGVRRADVRLGEMVAVIGLGLIGQLSVQLLKASGCRVIGIDINSERIQRALSAGMDYGVNPGVDNAATSVRNISSGFGVDSTIITADSRESSIIQQAMEITRKKGRVVVVGSVGLDVQRKPFYQKEIDLLISCSYGPGRYDRAYEDDGIDYPYSYVRWTENRNMQAYLNLIADNKIDFGKLVGGEYDIEKAGDAFDSLKTGPDRPLAVLIRYAEKDRDEGRDSTVVRINAAPLDGRIRTGIIGCGSFAVEMHLPNLKKLKDRFSIHALAGRDGARVRNIGRQFDAAYATTDYRKILEDPDIDMVMICTRHHMHAGMAIEAMRAGKAVFLEKPLATTEEQFFEIRDFLKNRGDQARLIIGFNRRFSPAARRVREILSQRVNPVIIIYRVNAGYAPLDFWIHTDEGGGRIIGEACHMLDLFRYFVGHPPETVDVSSITPTTNHISMTDNMVATIKYADGSLCSLIYSSLGNNEVEKERIEILNDNRILTIHDFSTLDIKGTKEKGWNAKSADKGHLRELQEFADYLQGRGEMPMSLEEIEETTELSFLINKMAGQKDTGA